MIVDGNKRAREIKGELKVLVDTMSHKPKLVVVSVGSDPVTERYLKKKETFGRDIGVDVYVRKEDVDISEKELASVIRDLAGDDSVNGIVVQLPLPKHIETKNILSLIPPGKDPDALGAKPKAPSPVVGAIKDILDVNKITLKNKKVVVVGRGLLVGEPAERWLREGGATVEVVDIDTENPTGVLKTADIIVSGAGVPGLITPEKIKDGVVLLDAGMSESAGALKGDADPACANLCSVFTPVPGGIGPMTIAILFRNLLDFSVL